MEYGSEPLLKPNNKYQKAYNNYKDEFRSQTHALDFDEVSVFDAMTLDEFELENRSIIGHIFQKECNRLNESNIYFYGCSFENYKYNYEKRLNDFQTRYIDVNECDFIESELKLNIHYFLNDFSERQINFSLKLRSEFLNDRKAQITTQPQQTETETPTTETAPVNSLNWQGSELEFAELVKALLLTKKLNPELKEVEIFKRLKLFFNIKEFDHTDKIRNVKDRTKDVPVFINILETALNNWAEK